jgi:hypothetical protein
MEMTTGHFYGVILLIFVGTTAPPPLLSESDLIAEVRIFVDTG